MRVLLAVPAFVLLAAPPQIPVTREAYLMGTRAVLAAWQADRRSGLATLDRLLRQLESTDAQLSTWRPDSEVSRLNAAAGTGPFRLSRSLCRLLEDVQHWVRETGGAFDPAIGALVSAWDVHGRGRVPAADALEHARGSSGWRHLTLDRAACTLASAAGVTLDPGGFGKGEALDRARAAADSSVPWMIDLGGQVAVNGTPPGEDGWLVGIAHPQRRDEAIMRIRLRSGSLATSGGSERDRQVEGQRIGHILDPATGRGAQFRGSVIVWHERALTADALSTALFVTGPDEGLRWAGARGVAVLYLVPHSPTEVIARASPAFAARFGQPVRGRSGSGR